MFLSAEEHAAFTRVCVDLAEALQRLRHDADTRSQARWQIRPKMHKMCHLPLAASSINPRIVGCYADESHTGTCCKVWMRSLVGRYANSIQNTVLAKRLLAVVVRYELGLS